MKINEKDLRDPVLGRALRRALDEGEIPDEWLADVRVAIRTTTAPVFPMRPEPVWRLILPHLAGGLAALVFIVSWFLSSDIRASFLGILTGVGSIGRVLVSMWPSVSPTLPHEAVVSLAAIALILEASRGFQDIRRWID